MLQNSYRVTLKITNMQVQNNDFSDHWIYGKELGISEVLIINCQFNSNIYKNCLFSFASSTNGSVQFINCQFINNIFEWWTYPKPISKPSLIKLNQIVKIELMGCDFYAARSIFPAQVLQTHGNNTNPATTQVIIKYTNFTYYADHDFQQLDPNINTSFISLLDTTLLLEDSVDFVTFLLPIASFLLKKTV